MLKFIFLGAIQGLTEFLPISSSGHLVIAQHLLGLNKDILYLDVFLHLGTILAIPTFFFKDICSILKNPKWIVYIGVLTFITGSIGITFRNTFESFFYSARDVAVFLMINGLILILTKNATERLREPDILDSTIMGITQGLAITPGISRSGITISTLLFRGIRKEEAFKFSFMAAIPVVVGAFLLETKGLRLPSAFRPIDLIMAIISSYLFGLLALYVLMKTIKNKKLYFFGYYCLLLGGSVLFFL